MPQEVVSDYRLHVPRAPRHYRPKRFTRGVWLSRGMRPGPSPHPEEIRAACL